MEADQHESAGPQHPLEVAEDSGDLNIWDVNHRPEGEQLGVSGLLAELTGTGVCGVLRFAVDTGGPES